MDATRADMDGSVAETRGRPLSSTTFLSYLFVVVSFCILHLALFFHDNSNTNLFLDGDRGPFRQEKIERYDAAAPGNPAAIFDQGPPGDYVFHAWIEKSGGRPAIILLQVVLTLLTVVMTMRLVDGVSENGWMVGLAGALSVLAPSMLMSPHQLVTEPWSAFCLTLGCYCCVFSLLSRRQSLLSVAFLAFAAASVFRPGNLLVPLIAGVGLTAFCRIRLRTAVVLVIVSYAVYPGSWLVIRFLNTGEFGLGASDFDLNRNYWLRATRVAVSGDSFDPYVGGWKMPFAPFVSVILEHPWATVKTYAADAANLLLNSGTNQVFGRYLHVIVTPDDKWFFRNLLDSHGIGSVIGAMLGLGPAFIITYAVYEVPQLMILLGYLCAPWLIKRRQFEESPIVALLWMLIMASLAGVFVAGGVRWTQRATVEPVSAALVAILLGALIRRWSGRPRPARVA